MEEVGDVAEATERGTHRISQSNQLPWPFLSHTGPPIRPPPSQN